jgi:hypothetical protein
MMAHALPLATTTTTLAARAAARACGGDRKFAKKMMKMKASPSLRRMGMGGSGAPRVRSRTAAVTAAASDDDPLSVQIENALTAAFPPK